MGHTDQIAFEAEFGRVLLLSFVNFICSNCLYEGGKERRKKKDGDKKRICKTWLRGSARETCISTYLCIYIPITNQATLMLFTEGKRRKMQVSLLNMFSV